MVLDLAKHAVLGAHNPAEMLARLTAQHPIGRLGTEAGLRAAAAFLCGRQAGRIAIPDLVRDGSLTISTLSRPRLGAPAMMAP